MKRSMLAGLGMTVGGLLGRAVVGFLGLAMVVGAVAPQPDPDRRTRSERDDEPLPVNRMTLRVPEGQPENRLTMVDESGRQLAVVTRGRDGQIGFMARARDGAGVCCWLKDASATFVSLIGTARETFIEVQPDGTAKSSMGNFSGQPQQSGNPQRSGQAEAPGLTEAARVVRAQPVLSD